jgi:hypothetical protein
MKLYRGVDQNLIPQIDEDGYIWCFGETFYPHEAFLDNGEPYMLEIDTDAKELFYTPTGRWSYRVHGLAAPDTYRILRFDV